MIKGGDLDNRQEDPRGSADADQALRRLKERRPKGEPDPAEASPSLAERIEAARALRPPRSSAVHCGCCFGQGRDAAIRVIEEGGS